MKRPRFVNVNGKSYDLSPADSIKTLRMRYEAAVARDDQYSPTVIQAKLDALLKLQEPTPAK